MKTLTLTRVVPSTDEGTRGRAVLSSGEEFDTLELPWKNNEHLVSCIPTGTYEATFTYSPHFKKDLYELLSVPGRSDIRIHSGNFAGDTSKGWLSDITGCILLGRETTILKGQVAVVLSRLALADFHAATNGEPIRVVIQ